LTDLLDRARVDRPLLLLELRQKDGQAIVL
jgi:hypothetical protein